MNIKTDFAKQVAMVWACVVKRRQCLAEEYEVDGSRPRGRP